MPTGMAKVKIDTQVEGIVMTAPRGTEEVWMTVPGGMCRTTSQAKVQESLLLPETL